MRADKRANIALIAAWLILFQLFAPLAFAGTDYTLLCSDRGVERISYDDQGNAIPLPTEAEHCELCFLSHDDSLISPTQAVAFSHKKSDNPLRSQISYLKTQTVRLYHSRAPPA